MIKNITGNLLESEADALVNTVNTVGVMGKGIALQFKKQYPHNAKVYREACKAGTFGIGDILVVADSSLIRGDKWIINFPTKKHWRNPSKYEYIEAGLERLAVVIQEYGIKSIAIPPLGSGNGGLNWTIVKPMIIKALENVDCEIWLYEPNAVIKETLKKESVKLTPARAMLLAVAYEMVRHGEFLSEFSAEKIAYFLQKFGGKQSLKLEYKPYIYGPYSGKVRHVLHYLNGSYLMGYQDKNKKPFEPLSLLLSKEKEVLAYLDQAHLQQEKEIVVRTKQFLEGFYDNFALELLSTLDYIVEQEETTDYGQISNALKQWSNRKSKEFGEERYIQFGLEKIMGNGISEQ
jgi:O-acetyl-ADP-ribose deacetylase (regulator of RNase III)